MQDILCVESCIELDRFPLEALFLELMSSATPVPFPDYDACVRTMFLAKNTLRIMPFLLSNFILFIKSVLYPYFACISLPRYVKILTKWNDLQY